MSVSGARSRLPAQAVVLAVAVGLWVVTDVHALWAGLACYAVVWFVMNGLVAMRPTLLSVHASPAQLVLLGALVAGPSSVVMLRHGDSLLEGEGLPGLGRSLADRLRLENLPSIAPPVVFADHPQSFYVHAPGGDRAEVRFGASETLEGTRLGHGLFRVDYDPARDGTPREGEGEIVATLTIDGDGVDRDMIAVRPQPHPRWLRSSPDGRMAATVSEETDQLAIVDGDGLVRLVEVGDGPTDCAFIDDDRIAVSHRYDDSLLLLDARRGEVIARLALTAGQVRLATNPDRSRLAVAVDGAEAVVHVVATARFEVQETHRLDFAPDWIAYAANDALIVSSRQPAALHRLGPASAPLLLGRPAVTMAGSPDGARLYVATTDYAADGEPHYGDPHYGNHYVQDQILTVDVARWRIADQWLTARRSARQSSAGNVDRGASPMGIEPLGDGRMRIAFAGTDEVWTVEPGRPTPRVHDLADLPLASPHGVATLAGGHWVVSSPSDGTLGIFDARGVLLTLVRLGPDDDHLLETTPTALQRRLGEHGFYEATRSGISCQSCHLHAGTDGVLRNIGERRLAPTLTVGGIAGTAPYLRDGSYPRVRDLEHLAETLFRGYMRRAPGRSLNLEAYVEGLPRPVAHGERDDARERAGLTVFVEARCPTCHAFPAFTNLGQHPVHALFPDAALPSDSVVDTPSLLSVSSHPPYLTDGRAADLRGVIEDHNASNRHGDTRALDPRELDDLVAFLESL